VVDHNYFKETFFENFFIAEARAYDNALRNRRSWIQIPADPPLLFPKSTFPIGFCVTLAKSEIEKRDD
jgi:hypothetical protein